MVGEMVSSLIQIKIFNGRKKLIKEFSKRLNQTFRANLCY
jgi:hypothetical protein